MKKTLHICIFMLAAAFMCQAPAYGRQLPFIGGLGTAMIAVPQGVNYLLVRYNESEGFVLIDLNGNEIAKWNGSPTGFAEKDGIIVTRDVDGMIKLLDVKNKLMQIGTLYRSATCFDRGYAIVAPEGGPLRIIDMSGREIKILDQWNGEEIEKATMFSEGMAAVRTESGYWGFVNTMGQMVIAPRFDRVSYFSEGYCVVEKKVNDSVQSGIIDLQGNFVLPLSSSFELSAKVKQGMLAHRTDGYFGVIDVKGKEVIKPNPDFNTLGEFGAMGLAIFSNGQSMGLIDQKGEIRLRARYNNIQVSDKQVVVSDLNNQKSYLLNSKLNEVKEVSQMFPVLLPNGNYYSITIFNGAILLDKDLNEIGKRTIIEMSHDFYSRSADLAQSDYIRMDGIGGQLLDTFGIQVMKRAYSSTTISDLVSLFHLSKPYRDDEMDNAWLNRPARQGWTVYPPLSAVFNPGHEDVSGGRDLFGPEKKSQREALLKSEEKRIRDSIESAQRLADSLAALEAYGGEFYDDTLYFISETNIQHVKGIRSKFYALNYSFEFDGDVKTRLFKERKNGCDECQPKGTMMNNDSKLKAATMNVVLRDRAEGKAIAVFEEMKQALTKRGYILVKELRDNSANFIIMDQKGKKAGNIELLGNSRIEYRTLI